MHKFQNFAWNPQNGYNIVVETSWSYMPGKGGIFMFSNSWCFPIPNWNLVVDNMLKNLIKMKSSSTKCWSIGHWSCQRDKKLDTCQYSLQISTFPLYLQNIGDLHDMLHFVQLFFNYVPMKNCTLWNWTTLHVHVKVFSC
jgi:hypothetical protein